MMPTAETLAHDIYDMVLKQVQDLGHTETIEVLTMVSSHIDMQINHLSCGPDDDDDLDNDDDEDFEDDFELEDGEEFASEEDE